MLALCTHLELKRNGRRRKVVSVADIVGMVIWAQAGLMDVLENRHRRSLHRIVVDVFQRLRTLLHYWLSLKFRQKHGFLKRSFSLGGIALGSV